MFDKLQDRRRVQQVFDEVAAVYDLVYFGSSDMKESDDPILGFTYQKDAEDDHFMHGIINDYETSIIHRSVTLSHPHHSDGDFTWTIVRAKLKVTDLPHIFIDAHQYDELLYKHIFAKYPKLRSITKSLAANASFAEHFNVFSTPEMNAHITSYFDDSMMQHMLEAMSSIDVEIDGDEIMLAHSGTPHDTNDVKKMIDNLSWLVERIERKHVAHLSQDE